MRRPNGSEKKGGNGLGVSLTVPALSWTTAPPLGVQFSPGPVTLSPPPPLQAMGGNSFHPCYSLGASAPLIHALQPAQPSSHREKPMHSVPSFKPSRQVLLLPGPRQAACFCSTTHFLFLWAPEGGKS